MISFPFLSDLLVARPFLLVSVVHCHSFVALICCACRLHVLPSASPCKYCCADQRWRWPRYWVQLCFSEYCKWVEINVFYPGGSTSSKSYFTSKINFVWCVSERREVFCLYQRNLVPAKTKTQREWWSAPRPNCRGDHGIFRLFKSLILLHRLLIRLKHITGAIKHSGAFFWWRNCSGHSMNCIIQTEQVGRGKIFSV